MVVVQNTAEMARFDIKLGLPAPARMSAMLPKYHVPRAADMDDWQNQALVWLDDHSLQSLPIHSWWDAEQ